MKIRMPAVNCPGCNKPFEPELSAEVSTHTPPIDLDGVTHVGCHEDFTCPHCGEELELNVARTLAGTEPSVSDVNFADMKLDHVDELHWSASGKLLAVYMTIFHIFRIDVKKGCDLLDHGSAAQMLGWDGESFVTFAFDGPGMQTQYRTTSYLPRRKQSKWLYPRTKWSYDRAWAVAGRRSGVAGYRIDNVPHVEIRDMDSARVCRQDVLVGKDGWAKFWFNLPGNVVLCARHKPCTPSNTLELWRFNMAAQSMELAGAYCAANAFFEWAAGDGEGNILVVELNQKKSTPPNRPMPYGLVRFSGRDLSVFQCEKQLDPSLCPQGVALKHVRPLPNGQIVWCTDKLCLLDSRTWKCASTFPVAIGANSRVATSPIGDRTAITTEKSVLIYDHATQALTPVRRSKATK